MDPAAPFDDPPAGATAVGITNPLDRGDVVNLMADLRRRLATDAELPKLTDVQNRLVMKRLEAAGTWERPRAKVEEQVAEIAAVVSDLTALDEAAIHGAITDCI